MNTNVMLRYSFELLIKHSFILIYTLYYYKHFYKYFNTIFPLCNPLLHMSEDRIMSATQVPMTRDH